VAAGALDLYDDNGAQLGDAGSVKASIVFNRSDSVVAKLQNGEETSSRSRVSLTSFPRAAQAAPAG